MSREWKPGDVAMVNDCTRPERPWELATCIAAKTPQRETMWRLHKNGGEVWGSVSDARPLVVIDPEDREAVNRLGDAFCKARWDHTPGSTECDPLTSSSMQIALREFANPTPPKPDEPLGLGAVVEDDKGARYSRVAGDDAFPWAKSPVDEWQIVCFAWDEINAVRILSEGVQP